ncbi:MAG: copper resistance protein NlpE N-terminal domain-containing protein [Eudoraea sp.]|uniref:copper resistance protein NlpE N-terminal domain-containing protein n=1 Tax=Eudoraea sp. TaxID=1979955 RepID=UPI003C716E5A
MKKFIAVLFLMSGLTLFSQSDNMIGEYYLKLGDDKHLIEYRLTLNQDQTFIFHSYVNHEAGMPQIINEYGKGNWTADGKIISFFSDNEKDFDEKNTLDLSNSRARFITKPSRDKTDRIIKTRLKFFESEIFWIEGLDIFKV